MYLWLTASRCGVYAPFMSELLTPHEIERLARERGLTLTELSIRSGVARSIFQRWKVGKQNPTIRSYQALVAAVMAAEPVAAEPVAAEPAVAAPLAIVVPAAIPPPRQRPRTRAV